MCTVLLHFRLLTLLWQPVSHKAFTQFYAKISEFFFSKVQKGGTWTTPLGHTTKSAFCQCFHILACSEAGFAASHLSWSVLSRVLNMLNMTHYPAFTFYNHSLLSKVIHASPGQAGTLSAASSAWQSCVHTLPQSVWAVLSDPPSSTPNGFFTHSSHLNAYSQLVPQSTGTFQRGLAQSSEVTILLGK